MIEGIGLAGADPGLCYALASQIFGMQFPLRDARAGAPPRPRARARGGWHRGPRAPPPTAVGVPAHRMA
ncbi:hypothetical protein, partial [Streptomyces platensis]|uniref:hypothetical protein n=1 Tax=Streptomyces platensis TaxID=58346 RepID=UPI0036828ACC